MGAVRCLPSLCLCLFVLSPPRRLFLIDLPTPPLPPSLPPSSPNTTHRKQSPPSSCAFPLCVRHTSRNAPLFTTAPSSPSLPPSTIMALDVKEKNLIKFIVKRLVPILIVFFSFASYMELWNQPVRLLGFSLLAVWLIKFLNLALYFVRAKLFPRDPLSYGKWAIVTGATAGIGEAFAYELAARGMNVIIISRSLEKLEEVKKGILKETPGVEVRCMAYDYTDRAGADAFFAKLAETCKGLVGGLGILVNNVGMVNAVSV